MFGVDYFAKKVIEYAFLFLSLQEKEIEYESRSNRGPSECRQKHPLQPSGRPAKGHRRCHGRNHPRTPLR